MYPAPSRSGCLCSPGPCGAVQASSHISRGLTCRSPGPPRTASRLRPRRSQPAGAAASRSAAIQPQLLRYFCCSCRGMLVWPLARSAAIQPPAQLQSPFRVIRVAYLRIGSAVQPPSCAHPHGRPPWPAACAVPGMRGLHARRARRPASMAEGSSDAHALPARRGGAARPRPHRGTPSASRHGPPAFRVQPALAAWGEDAQMRARRLLLLRRGNAARPPPRPSRCLGPAAA